MKKRRYKLKSYVKYTIYIAFLIFLFGLTAFFYYKRYDSQIIEKISYKDSANIDYKVYLKENNFFETPYLGKDTTYISSLIEYIDVTFDYKMNYSKPITGKYSYYIQATLLANKANDEEKNYWSKSYIINDVKDMEVTNQDYFAINTNVKIDYQQYNDLLTGFKKEFSLPIDGVLKIELIVKSNVKNETITKEIINDTNYYMQMPLTQSSVDIAIKTSSEDSNLKEIIESNNKVSNIYRVLAYSFFLIAVVSTIIVVVKSVNERKKKHFYEVELKRILSTYDGIIVNVEKLQDLSKYNIINVKSFDELIDAHSEVRMPINFIELEKNEESVFVLISDNIAWVYKLIDK